MPDEHELERQCVELAESWGLRHWRWGEHVGTAAGQGRRYFEDEDVEARFEFRDAPDPFGGELVFHERVAGDDNYFVVTSVDHFKFIVEGLRERRIKERSLLERRYRNTRRRNYNA